MTRRELPQNIEAEEACLGSLLLNPLGLATCMDCDLEPDHFYLVKHQWIYQAMLDLFKGDAAIDYITLTTLLETRGQLEETGGAGYVTSLIEHTPTAMHLESYARIIHGTAMRRRIIAVSGETAAKAYDQDGTWLNVIEYAEAAIFGLTTASNNGRLESLANTLSDFYDVLAAIQNGELTGIPTGYEDLDRLLGGLQRGDEIVVAGRPGMGKTTLLLNLALNVAYTGRKVAVFSLEMSKEQLALRLVANKANVDAQLLRSGRLDDADYAKVIAAAGSLAEHASIFIDDTPYLTPLRLKSKCRQQAMITGLDLIIVDYLQLMAGDQRKENRAQELSAITKAGKALARELNVPLIFASQLNRGVESRADKRPIMADLRDSGATEEDADVIIFIYRDEVYVPDTELPNIADLIVSKHRHGPTGTIQLFFRKHLSQFLNATVTQRDLGFL